MWCHLLSKKRFTEVIVVFSSKEAQFMFPKDWQERVAGLRIDVSRVFQ